MNFALRGSFKIIEARDGKEALDILRSGAHPIRLVFCDLAMPRLDGRGFCSEWSRDPNISRIPVVLVSGEREVAEIAKACGTMGFIRKPAGIDDLEEAIRLYALAA